MKQFIGIALMLFSMSIQAQDDIYVAVHQNDRNATWTATLTVNGQSVSAILVGKFDNTVHQIRCSSGKIKSSGKFKLYCKSPGVNNRTLKGTLEHAVFKANAGRAGGATFRFVHGDALLQFNQQKESTPSLTTDQFLDQ